MLSLVFQALSRLSRSPRPLLVAAAAGCAPGLWGCGKDAATEVEPPPAPIMDPAPPVLDAGTDVDGVIKLYPDAPGMRFVLAQSDPNESEQLVIEEGTTAVAGREGPLSFWSIDTYDFEYTEGSTQGKTARLHIRGPGLEQLYDWQTQQGFLAD